MQKDLLLLHGALGAQQQFTKLEQQLSGKFNIHKFDFISHGSNSELSDHFGIVKFSEQLKRFCIDKNLKNPFVFGYSMGGYVAMYLEAISPGTFSKIFTLGTKFQWNEETSQKEAGMLNTEKMQENYPEYVSSLDKLHTGTGWKTLMNLTAEMMIELGKNPVLTDELLSNIEIQCRVSIGDRDKMVRFEETIDTFKKLKNGSFLVLPDTQHPFERVKSERITYELNSFFD